MKVWGLYKCEMDMPFWNESVVALYMNKDEADAQADVLNLANTNPVEEDSYGPLRGCEYRVHAMEVQE